MLGVAWWLLLAWASQAALFKAWSALALPDPGMVVAGLMFYVVLYAVVAAHARRHLDGIHPLPLGSMAPGLLIPVLMATLGALVLSYQGYQLCVALDVLPPRAFDVTPPAAPAYAAPPSLLATLVSVAVVAPVFEEALMRGIVLQALATSMSKRRAILISALFFAVMHGAIERAPGTFILGLLYGWMFVRTGSLLPGMLAHALHNATVVLLTSRHAWPDAVHSTIRVDQYGLLPIWLVCAAAALTLIGALLMGSTAIATPAAAVDARGVEESPSEAA